MPWSSWSVQLPPLLSVKVERSGAHLGLPLRWTWDCVRTHSWFGFRRIKSWLWFCLLFHQGIAKFVVSWIFWQPRLKCFLHCCLHEWKELFVRKQDKCYSPLRLQRNFTVPWQSEKQHQQKWCLIVESVSLQSGVVSHQPSELYSMLPWVKPTHYLNSIIQ